MKKKILLIVSIACILCSCGKIENEDNKSNKIDTENSVTTTSETVATTTTVSEEDINVDGSEEFVDYNDTVTFDDYDEFYAKLVETHGDEFNIPDYDKDKYTFKCAEFYELNGSFLIELKEDNGNIIRFNGRGTTKQTTPIKDLYEDMYNWYVPWSGADMVLREDLNGYFCEFDTAKGNYWFTGTDKYGYYYYVEYSSKDEDTTMELLEEKMREFGVEFTEI